MMENRNEHRRIKENRNKNFIFRLTDREEQMLKDLSFHLDRSRSDIVRRALNLFYSTVEHQIK